MCFSEQIQHFQSSIKWKKLTFNKGYRKKGFFSVWIVIIWSCLDWLNHYHHRHHLILPSLAESSPSSSFDLAFTMARSSSSFDLAFIGWTIITIRSCLYWVKSNGHLLFLIADKNVKSNKSYLTQWFVRSLIRMTSIINLNLYISAYKNRAAAIKNGFQSWRAGSIDNNLRTERVTTSPGLPYYFIGNK